MITVNELVERLKKVDEKFEVRIVNQYNEETGDTYHTQIDDVYIFSEDGREDIIILESDNV